MGWNELNAPRFDTFARRLGGLRQAGVLVAMAGELTPVLAVPTGPEDELQAGRAPWGTQQLASPAIPPATIGYIGILNDTPSRLLCVQVICRALTGGATGQVYVLPPPFTLAVAATGSAAGRDSRALGKLALWFTGSQPALPLGVQVSAEITVSPAAGQPNTGFLGNFVIAPGACVILATQVAAGTVVGAFQGWSRSADDAELQPTGL